MSLINLFKEFHREAIQQEFPPSARVLFDTLLYKFNEAYWQGELVLSERDLIQLTGLPKTTVNEAKRFLASRHIIKIAKFKNKTAYRFGDEWKKLAPTANRPLTDHSPTINRPLDDVPYIRAREDVKTLDLRHSFNQSVDAQARDTSELDSILEYWDELKGGRLTFEHQSALNALLKEKSADWVKSAMKEAADANSNPRGLSPKFLFAVIKRKAQPLKGGDKNARQFDYDEEPDTSWIKPYR